MPRVKKQLTPNKKPQKSGGAGDYTAKEITVLGGLEPVRKRPGMYIGSTGPDGLHHLIWEVLDNSLDEAMGGHATHIAITLHKDNKVSVEDDGRGIPVEKHPQTKKSALETVMTMLHAGAKFGGKSYTISGGLHGVGVSVVNALSEWLRVEVCRGGQRYAQEYNRGKPKSAVKKIGRCGPGTGTKVTFYPDLEVFKEIKFDWKRIIDHIREQAYLTPGVFIRVTDESKNFTYGFSFSGGVESFVRYLTEDHVLIHEKSFYAKAEKEGMWVEVAFQYTDDIEPFELGFANNIHTAEGGMHITGFRSALTRTLNDYAKKEGIFKADDENLTGDDVREGLYAIVSVKLREPQFEGQTKAKLGNLEARTATEVVLSEAIPDWLERNPQDARQIIGKCLLASKARKAAKAAKDAVIRKGALEGMMLPGKLADCQTRDPEEAELFIVEGDSAGGSCKQGRDRRYQAILPLRGKILNIEKARIDKALSSKEIKALVIALGAAIGEDFNIEKLRYHRIIITCDADTDGNHIRTLLLTLFYRYFQPVIQAGYLYIAQPPLYRIQQGKEVRYAYTEDEKGRVLGELQKEKEHKAKAALKKKGKKETPQPQEVTAGEVEAEASTKGIAIQRYKGLGEMNPEQLWETTMDPGKRTLKQVAIEDAKDADKIFDVLMGEEVEPRKRWLQAHAKAVRNLDI